MAARVEAASQPNRVMVSAATAKILGADFVLDGPHNIETKEALALEAFFVSRRAYRDRQLAGGVGSVRRGDQHVRPAHPALELVPKSAVLKCPKGVVHHA